MMKSLRSLMLVLLLATVVGTASWSATTAAPPQPGKTVGTARERFKARIKDRAMKEKAAESKKTSVVKPEATRKTAASEKSKEVKGYTTKSGKVVKGYTRKTTTKTPEAAVGSKGGAGPKTVHVKGYCKKNGVCVKGYERRAPMNKQSP